jgi:formylglycine-generating enzyme required for sulfatase activity
MSYIICIKRRAQRVHGDCRADSGEIGTTAVLPERSRLAGRKIPSDGDFLMRSVVIRAVVLGSFAAAALMAETGLSQEGAPFRFVKAKARMIDQPVYYLEYYQDDQRYYLPIILGSELDQKKEKPGEVVALQLGPKVKAALVDLQGAPKAAPPLPIDWVRHFLGKDHLPAKISVLDFRACVPSPALDPKEGTLPAGYRLPEADKEYLAARVRVGPEKEQSHVAIWPAGAKELVLLVPDGPNHSLLEALPLVWVKEQAVPPKARWVTVGRPLVPDSVKESTLVIYPADAHGDARVILQYPQEMVAGEPDSHRLALDLSRIVLPPNAQQRPWDPRSQVLADAFGDILAGTFRPHPVTLADFERLLILSFDATHAKRVGVKKPNEREAFEVRHGKAPRYLALTNEAQRKYLGGGAPDEVKGIEEVRVAFWPGTVQIAPGFVAAEGGSVLLKDKQYPIRIRSLKDTSLRFVLIDPGNAPFYLQEFETTIRQWEDFLENDRAKELYFLDPADKQQTKTYEALFGPGEPASKFDAYLAKAVSRSGKKADDSWKGKVAILKEWAKADRGLPMTMVSQEAAEHYATWVGGKLPTTEQWAAARKLVERPGLADRDRPATLKELKENNADKVVNYGAAVFGLERNVRELVLGGPDGLLLQGDPWFDRQDWGDDGWKGEAAQTKRQRLDQYTGFRLVVVMP